MKRAKGDRPALLLLPDETWEHAGIVLSPLNREYAPIVIPPQDAADFRIIAEFVGVLRPAT